MPESRKVETLTGTRGAVAAGHELTARSAIEVLEAGGNAIDAAIAAAAMSCLSEPVLSSPGAGGFALVHRPGKEPKVIDFFAHTPKEHRTTLPNGGMSKITAYYGTTTGEYLIGPGSTATPGFIPGIMALASLGASKDFKELFAPTITAARKGIAVDVFQAHIFQVVREILNTTESSQKVFAPNGPLLEAGELFKNPGLAETFELIASGPQGIAEVNRAIIKTQNNGNLTQEDIDGYVAHIRDPLVIDVSGNQVFLNPLPAAGGLYIANTLRHLANIETTQSAPRSSPRGSEIADSDTAGSAGSSGSAGGGGGSVADGGTRGPWAQPSIEAIAQALAATEQDRIVSGGELHKLADMSEVTRGTTHFSVADGHGSIVSITLSIGEGNGQIVGDYGFMLNNMLGEADVNPHGPLGWPTDTRLSSMMCPTLVAHRDGTRSGFGTGGSSRIRSVIAQIVMRLAAGADLTDAIEAPRLHIENGAFDIESHARLVDNAAVEKLCEEYVNDHRVWDVSNMFFGGINAVSQLSDSTLVAIGDPRRAGRALTI